MNPTPERAALDSWLESAEEVLLEQRQYSISPSSADADRRGDHRRLATLGEVEHDLASVLQRLVFDPGRWILIIEDVHADNRFVQFLVYEDGSLVAETVSNHYLDGNDRWTPVAEAGLVALGWGEPAFPRRPNWLVVYPTFSPPVAEVASLVVTTLHQVFALGDRDRVIVTLFSSLLRGDTPAGEVHSPKATDTDGGDSLLQCGSYSPGHTPHWIQVFHSRKADEDAPVDGELIEVTDDGLVVIRVDGHLRRFWNHEPARLARLAACNDGAVTVQERWHLLRTPSGDAGSVYGFSIGNAAEDTYRPCGAR